MKKRDIPKTVMTEILDRASADWDDDEEERKFMVDAECEAYCKFKDFDFGTADAAKDKIVDCALDLMESWEDRFDLIEDEVEAYLELESVTPSDLPQDHLNQLKKVASEKHPQSFVDQWEHISGGIAKFRYVNELNQKIEPIKDVLISMERIIGDECYNAKIQNYGSWGVWEGEGRSFRYPVCFSADEGDVKKHNIPSDIEAEVLMTGRYKFGQNELNIFRALAKIVEMLEEEYGVRLSDNANESSTPETQ